MIPKPLNEITEVDIQRMKSTGREEGKTIEFKRELPGTKDDDKREFLADATSFANTEGGDIIYGVAEEQGVITDIVGLSSTDFDAEILRLDNLIRDGVSPRMSASLRTVSCETGTLVVLRIERNWIGPHRVVFRGHDKFYARNSAGKFALDVSQLRTAFLQSATLSEQISGFRLDRIIDIANDRAPVSLVKAPTLVLHFIPIGAFADQAQFDLTLLQRNPIPHRPWNESGWDRRMTFDGVLIHGFIRDQGAANSYAHFYRNGILDAVTTSLLETRQVAGRRLIPHASFEKTVLEYLPSCLQSLQQIGVIPPISVSLTLIGVRGLCMAPAPFSSDYGNEIREENLIIPGTIVEDLSTPAGTILKPMFDRVWNACGLVGSENFDVQGNWSQRRSF